MTDWPEMKFARQFVRESALIEGQVIPDDVLDVSSHMQAYLYAIGMGDARSMLQEGDLKNMQRLVAGEQHRWGDRRALDDWLGRYRQHDIAIGFADGSTKEIGTHYWDVPARMREIIQVVWNWPLFVPQEDTPVKYAATVHWRFERIHPFPDGNGRTGRLLVAYMMRAMREDPILFTNSDKVETYYPCFEEDLPDRMIDYFTKHQVRGDGTWG